ncbi:hypothetical protein B0H17DRAFT_1197062 [Mycena rosella]|uniref:Uncharacterized protein n=1 Tax=Mycena rosella TaxID=1033263 RepID=A0AAD7DSM2_MYCRO|nr:hypothetical protein B0H17DRAFT_1197062 [Mycena rosella]
MARAVFALIFLLCIFQTLAAPLHRRADDAASDNAAFFAVGNTVLTAQLALGRINTTILFSDNPRFVLQTHLALIDAADVLGQIRDSSRLVFSGPPPAAPVGAPPAPVDAPARIVAVLTAAQTALNQTSVIAITAEGVATAEAGASIADGLAKAHQAVAINCTTAA